MTEGLIDDEQRGVSDQGEVCRPDIILKQIGEKEREKMQSICGFHRFGEVI